MFALSRYRIYLCRYLFLFARRIDARSSPTTIRAFLLDRRYYCAVGRGYIFRFIEF